MLFIVLRHNQHFAIEYMLYFFYMCVTCLPTILAVTIDSLNVFWVSVSDQDFKPNCWSPATLVFGKRFVNPSNMANKNGEFIWVKYDSPQVNLKKS